MQRLATALSLLGVGGVLAAQASNEIRLYSGVSNLHTRSALPASSAGDVCLRFPAAFFAGLGQTVDPVSNRPVRRITRMRFGVVDWNGLTTEAFEAGIKAADPGAPGRVDPVNDLVRIAGLRTPARTYPQTTAWHFSITFATPFDGLPAGGDVWAFVHLPVAPNWPTDGLTLFDSYWAGPGSAQPADAPNPRATLLPLVHTIDQTAILAGTPPRSAVTALSDHVPRIFLATPGVVLSVGIDVLPIAPYPYVGINPNFGVGGIYPDHGPVRRDGLAFRVEDANSDFSRVFVIGAFGGPRSGSPTPLSSLVAQGVGSLYLSPPVLSAVFASGSTNGAGWYMPVSFPWPLTVPAPVGRMSFQALVLDRHTGRWRASNLVGFDSQ